MKSFFKFAAAVTLAAVALLLAACGKSDTGNSLAQMEPHLVQSKITSADSSANALVVTVNGYIGECVANGGKIWNSGSIKITASGGNWTVSGYNADVYKPANVGETLLERLRGDFSSTKDFYAEIHINESGKAYAAIFTNTVGIAASEYPSRDAFREGAWSWDGKTAGVSPSGIIVGTSPRLPLR